MEKEIQEQVFRIQHGDHEVETQITLSLEELKDISNAITQAKDFGTFKRLTDLKTKLWWYITELD